MAGFTTMALIGLGLAAGKGLSKLTDKRTPPPSDIGDRGTVTPDGARRAPLPAPAPTPPMPASATANASAALGTAQTAAKKTRRKAAAAAQSSTPTLTGAVAPAVLQPKTLLGY